MTVLTTVMTTSKSFATVNLGALDEEEDEDNNSGYDTFLDDGTNSAYSGFPADEEKINGFELPLLWVMTTTKMRQAQIVQHTKNS